MTNSLPTVKLRALEPEDLEFFYSIENDPELWDVSDYTTPYSRYVLHDFIANSTCDIYKDGQVRWAIENEEGEVVGMIDLTNFDPHHSRAETGIVIAKIQKEQVCPVSLATANQLCWQCATPSPTLCTHKY